MKSSTKRGGTAVVVVAIVGLFIMAATTTRLTAKSVAVVVAPGPRTEVMATSVGDWPPSTLTTSTVAVQVPVVTTVGPATTVQARSKGNVTTRPTASIPSRFPPIAVGIPTTITVPSGPSPLTTPTLPTATVPSASHISVTLQVDPPSPRVGETVHFTLRATGGAWCCTTLVYFNDGTPPWIPFGSMNTGPCPSLSGTPSWRSDLTHVFAAPGVFTVQAEADGGSTCLAPPNFEWVYGRSSTAVTVSP